MRLRPPLFCRTCFLLSARCAILNLYDNIADRWSKKCPFRSDLITPLPEHIDNGETEIHVFYAKKMGEKYLERYNKYFKNPVIHELDMRHEELLGVHPEDWCALVREICCQR